MGRRFCTWTIVALALALAGLGHFYLLYQRVYLWDALIFYAFAGLLLLWAWRRSEAYGGCPRVRLALGQLGAIARRLPLRWALQRWAVLAALLNGLAAVVAAAAAPLIGPAFAAFLWAVSLLSLIAVLLGKRESLPHPPLEASVARVAQDDGLRRHAALLAGAAWILLLAGVMSLTLRDLPAPFQLLEERLESLLAGLHVDGPIPALVWMAAMTLLGTGLALMAWSRGGVATFSAFYPPAETRLPLTRDTSSHPPLTFLLALGGGLAWLAVVGSAAAGSVAGFVLPLWLASLALCGVMWWRVDRARQVRIELGGLDRVAWLLVPACVVAAVVTCYRLADVPSSLWGDEGAFWWWARDLAQGLPANPFDLGVYGAFPVMGSLYQSLWVRLFGPSVWSWRLSSAMAGALTVVPLFFLARRLFDLRVAWSAVALMISLPYFLAYTRTGFNNIQPLLPLTLGLWLLLEAARGGSRTLVYLGGVALGLASLTYTAGHIGLILAVAVLLFLLLRWRARSDALLSLGFCLVSGWLLAAGPLFLGSTLGGKSLGWKLVESFVGNVLYAQDFFSLQELTRLYPLWQLGEQQVFFEPRIYALLMGRGLIRTVLSLLTEGLFARHYVVAPLAWPGTVLFLAGLGWTLGRLRDLRGMLWATWTLCCLLLLSAFNAFPPNAAHMTPLIPALAVLTAQGVWLINDLFYRFIPSRWIHAIGVLLTAALVTLGLRAYFVRVPQQYAPNLENVMFWRAQEMEPGANLVFVLEEPYPPDFSVWGIEHFDLGVVYHPLPAEQAGTADWSALCGSDCRVFFLPERAESLLPQLRSELGAGRTQMHLDADGRAIGVEFAP